MSAPVSILRSPGMAETLPKLSNGGTFDDLEWPQPPVSRSLYSLKVIILQTVHATAGNMMSHGFLNDSWGFSLYNEAVM